MVSLIPQAEMAGPSAVARLKEIASDVRLPSRAALEQRLGVELFGASSSKLELRSPGSGNVTLSALARAVSELFLSQTDATLKIRSSQPLWLHSRPPPAAQLTARLAQTVVFSGLFYESHLQQFAAGLRPLALMVREPQAGLVRASSPAASEVAAPVASDAVVVDALDADTTPDFAGRADKAAPAAALPAANTMAKSSGPVPFLTVDGQDGKPVNNALLLHETAGVMQTVKTTESGPLGHLHGSGTVTARADLAPAALTAVKLEVPKTAGFDMFNADATPGVGKHVASAAPVSATTASALASAAAAALQDTNPRAVVNGPLLFATAYGQDGKPEKNSLFLQEAIRDVQTPKITATELQGESRSSSSLAAVIHPDATGLVRQQLELLSVPVFRWSGQAWPGTPLEWDIQRGQPEDAQTSAGLAVPPAWTTNLTISMPVLKSVQARLTLVGNTLQVRLVCEEDATLAVFHESRSLLAQRFGPLGLQLATLHMEVADTADGIGPPKI